MSALPAPENTDFRCGYAAILGEPNVGKSTLMNAVLGTKLSIVTPKPQTTRRRILGFHSTESHQIIFVDTPGVIAPRYSLQRAMVEAALRALQEADLTIFIDDASAMISRKSVLPERLEPLLRSSRKPAIAVLNKVDLIHDKNALLPVMAALAETGLFTASVPVSALRKNGIETVVTEAAALLPHHPPMFDPEDLTDLPQRFFVSEIIREKIFLLFREEVPYATEVVIASYEEKEKMDVIAADIIVERESQRKILIGKGGSAVKEIGTQARKDIEAFIGRQVFLELHVKVREDWRSSDTWVRRFGYDTPA